MADPMQICPSCAGQLSAGAEACPWCGAKLGADEEKTNAAPPKPPATRPDVGFGDGANRPLPENMPPPPRALPFAHLSSGQIMLRAIIIIMVVYLVLLFGRRAMENAACMSPMSPFCGNVGPSEP